jgi:hypothetical protein
LNFFSNFSIFINFWFVKVHTFVSSFPLDFSDQKVLGLDPSENM